MATGTGMTVRPSDGIDVRFLRTSKGDRVLRFSRSFPFSSDLSDGTAVEHVSFSETIEGTLTIGWRNSDVVAVAHGSAYVPFPLEIQAVLPCLDPAALGREHGVAPRVFKRLLGAAEGYVEGYVKKYHN